MAYQEFDGELDEPTYTEFSGKLDAPKARTWGEAAADGGRSFGASVNNTLKTLTDLAGVNNPASEFLEENAKTWRGNYSPAYKEELQRQDVEKAALGNDPSYAARAGLMAKQVVRNPIEGFGELAGNIAPMIVGGVAGMGVKGMAALGSAMGAGAVKGGIAETVQNAPDADLMPDPLYAQMRTGGMSEQDAKTALSEQRASYGDAYGKILLGAGIGAAVGRFGSVENAIANIGKRTAAQAQVGLLKGVGTGVAKEVATEIPQEMTETYLGNKGASDQGASIAVDQGVIEAGVKAGILSAVGGGVAGMTGRGAIQPAPQATPADIMAPSVTSVDQAIAVSQAAMDAGRQFQDLAISAPGDDLAMQRQISEASGNLEERAQAQAQIQSEREGAAAGTARDQRLTDAGQAWQDLGVTAPQDDLQAQRAGMRPIETAETPTAMQLALQRAQSKAVNIPTKAPDGASTGIVEQSAIPGNVPGPDAGAGVADGGPIPIDAGRTGAAATGAPLADSPVAVAARSGDANAVAPFSYVKNKSGTLLVSGDPVAIRAAFPQEHGITKFTGGQPAGVLFGIKSAPQVEAVLMEPELQGMAAAAFEQLHQQDVKEEIKQRLDLAKPAEVDQKKTPFKSFLREFGIQSEHTSDIAGKNRFNANNVLPATFRANGMSLDGLVEQAIERGFMQEGDRGNQNKLIEMIQAEIAGEAQVSSEFADGDAQARTERSQRAEIESQADRLGLPYDPSVSVDRLASMVRRVQSRLEKEVDASFNGRGSLKSERVLRDARETVARIERKRAQYERELAGFAEASIAEQDALLDVWNDEDGNPVISRMSDAQAVGAWYETNGTWSDQDGQADAGTNPDQGQVGAPVARGQEEGAGLDDQGRSQAQPGSVEAQRAADESQEGLTAPSRADVLAQQDRADNAQALDDKAQIDAEASRQTLTQQVAPEQRKDTSGDMFGEEKAELESAKHEADAAAKNEAAKDPNQGSMFDAPAEPETPFTYINGDRAEYTGKTEEIHGGLFYEVMFTEGAKSGTTAVTQRAPDGTNPGQRGPEASSGIVTPQIVPAKPASEMSASELLRAAADKMDAEPATDVNGNVIRRKKLEGADRFEHHELKGIPSDQLKAMALVVDYMNGDVDRPTLMKHLEDSGLPEGTIVSMTQRMRNDGPSNNEIDAMLARRDAAQDSAQPAAKAERIEDSEQGVAMFSRADSIDVSDPRTGISSVLLELGKINSLYQYPRSSKTSLEGIAADKGLMISDVDRNTEDGKLWMIANTTPTDAPGVKSWIVALPGGKHATLTNKNGEVYINVASVGEGQGGSRVYDLAANYAFNNGLKFIGDPNGVSPAAMRRRLENMLSTAIKYGSTDFLAPHADQIDGRPDIGVPALRWTDGDTLGNIRSMVDVSVASTKSTNPAATQDVRFDPATHTLRDGRNDVVDARRLSEMLGDEERTRGTGQAGNTTLRRNALFNSLLQSVGNRTATMEFIHREQDRGGSGIGGALEGSFYSHAAVRNPSTVERVQSAVAELIGTKQLPSQLGRVVATTAAEIKSHWEALIDKSVNIGSEGDAGVAQAFFDPRTKTVFLIADHISQGNETAVLAHELMHKHGAAVLGKDGWARLHGVISSWEHAQADSEEHAVYTYARNKVAAVGDHLSSQELFPYAVEAALKMGIKPSMAAKKGTVAYWLESVRQNLRMVWGKITGKPESFRTQDLVDLAFGIAQRENPAHASISLEAGGEPIAPESGGAQFSRATANPHSWDTPEASKFDDLVYKLQDKHIDTKRVMESIKATAGALADEKNVYLQEELFHGRAAARTEDFVNKELGPLINEMRMRGIDIPTLDEYLHARHAEEANDLIAQRNPDLQDGGSGMTTRAARDYLAKMDPAERKRLEAVAAKVDAILAGTRQLYADYSLESQDKVDGWGTMFKHYVPLMREDKDGAMGIGQGFSIKGKEVKGRTGSTRKVVDILANIAMQRERAIVRGEKNRVATALVGLVELNQNEEFWAVGPPPLEKVYDEKTDSVVERADPLFKSRENVIIAKVKQADGEVVEKAVRFNEDSERAMRMAAALKNLDATQLNGVLGLSAKITRYFAAINTQYNPIFGVVNLVRDFQGAILNLSTTPLKGHAKEIAGHTLSALKGVYLDARAARDGKPQTSAWAMLWEEFQAEGGQTGYRDLFASSADRAKAIEYELNPTAWMDGPLGKVFTANGALRVPLTLAQKNAEGLFGWLSDYNLAMENAVRLSAYKVGLEQGMSKQQAASLGKNLTVNFNRKGQVGQQAGAIYAFFNASMQGSVRIGKTLFDMDGNNAKSIRLSATGKKIVYGGMLLGTMQALLLAAAGFDDEEPPDFVRERSLIIPTGGKSYITIPMPLGLHVIPNMGRIPTEFVLGGFRHPAKHVIRLLGLTAGAFNPIGGGASLVQMLSPTAVDPLVALAENKDWTGKPIAKTSFNKATPGHALMKDTASAPSKLLAEAINSLTGGSKYTAGVFSPTPDQIDYLWGQATGGVGREIGKAQQTVSATLSGEDLPVHKIPLIGRFYGNADTQSAQSGKFYATINRLNEHEAEIKGLRKDRKVVELADYIKANPDAKLFERANAVEREVQKLRRLKREMTDLDAPPERIKTIETRITRLMTGFNEQADRLKQTP